MAVYNNVGDTIEGESVNFDGRVIRLQGVKKHPLTKKNMKLYTTDRNSHAVVTKEGKESDDTNVKAVTQHFHRNIDDKVTADALSVYTEIKAKVNITAIHGKGASGRHGTQFAGVNEHTIATVKIPLQNLLKQLGLSNNNLIIKKDAN